MRITAEWLAAKPLQDLLGCLNAAGEARVAGGAVRNALMGVAVHEVDVATSLTPEMVTALSGAAGFSVHPTGIEHGTVTVARDGVAYEVTTLRHDVETDGRRAKVAFTDDWKADAERRDFTMNALYAAADGEVFDPVGGLEDLRARRVRFVGEPQARIREDYLRILRFFRFHAQYAEGAPDRAALEACGGLKAGLKKLSPERIRQELMKLIIAPRALVALEAMESEGLLALVLPGAGLAVFRRMAAVDAAHGLAPDGVLRLAALAPAIDMKNALRLSNAEAARLEAMDEAPAISPAFRDGERRHVLYRMGAAAFRDCVRLHWAHADGGDGEWLKLLRLADAWAAPVFPVKGADLVALGLKPGPDMGAMLGRLEDWWMASDFTATKDELLARVSEGKTNG